MNVRVLISIIAVFIASLSSSYGQTQTLEINVECFDQVIGNVRCVKFSTNAIDDLESIQFTISFDPNVLKFVGDPVVGNSCLTNLVTDNIVTTTPGQFSFVWADSPKTLSQGCELFQLCFEFIGEPGSSSPITITSLAAELEATSLLGPVNVVVKDCTSEVLPNGREIVAKFCNPTSVNSNDGKICFYGIGGVGPYTYALKDKNGDIVSSGTIADKEEICVDNLSLQQYTISINDQGNIPFPAKTINLIDANTRPTFDLDSKFPSCFNRADGQLTLQNINVSTIGKSIKWSNGAFNVEQQQYLKNGNYTVSVTDQNGCTATKSIALLADTLRLTTAIVDGATCLGLNDGFVRLTGSGGTPFPDGTYSFAINNTAFFKASTNPFVSVSTPGGKIIIRMRDDAKNFLGNSNPCEIETMIDVPYKEKIKVDEFTIEDILCKGKDLGKVRFKLSGTGIGYSLIVQRKEGIPVMNINPTFTSEGNTGGFFNNELMAGKYFVVARSTKGCRDTIRFEIKEPTNPFTISADITQPSCNGPGRIKINTVGGVAPIKITWEDGQMVNEKTGLLPGTFKITVTDAINCDSVFNIVLTSSGNAQIKADVLKAITCKDAKDGEVIANTLSGTTFTYEWKNSLGQVVGTTKTLTGLDSGTYYLAATIDGCPAIDTVFLANPDGISIVAVNATKPECLKGGLRGSIGLTIEGGKGPYIFEWKKQGESTILGTQSLLPNLLAGTYTVQIKDQAGCTKDTIITLLPPDPFVIDVTNIIGASCFGISDGKANAKASGGTVQNNKYTFFWSNNQKSNGVFDRDINLTLSGGKNWVFVTDAKCVSDTVFFDITSPPPIIANYTSTGICGGDCKGQIDVLASGGSAPPLVVSWPTLSQTGSTVFNLCVGDYPFEVKDGNGCILRDTATIDAGDSIKIKLNESLSELISCRKSIGQLVVDVEGGKAPYQFNWIGSTSNTNVAKELSDGTYTVAVTDANGCSSSFSYTMSRPNPITAILSEPKAPNCFGGTSCITVLSASGGTGNYTMQINNGFRIPIDSCQQLFPGNYLFSIYDGSGCKTDYPINIPSGNEFSVNLGEDLNLTLGDSIDELRPIINTSTSIVNYTWTGQGNLACIETDCEALTGAPLSDYLVKLIVTDENGCTAVDEVQITVKDIRNVYLPNIFKQSSSDEKNKRFDIVIGDGVEEVEEFTIYDRWGDVVHTRKNYKPDLTTGWDGLLGGQQALPGVYVFRAKVKFVDGVFKVYHGDVMLLK